MVWVKRSSSAFNAAALVDDVRRSICLDSSGTYDQTT